MEKDDNIWRRKRISQRRRKQGQENEEYIWKLKMYFFAVEKINNRGKGGKYLEKEDIFCAGEE